MSDNIQGLPDERGEVTRIVSQELPAGMQSTFMGSVTDFVNSSLPQSQVQPPQQTKVQNTTNEETQNVSQGSVNIPETQTQNVQNPEQTITSNQSAENEEEKKVTDYILSQQGNPQDAFARKMAKSFLHAQKKIGVQGNELGNLRKLVSDFTNPDVVQGKVNARYNISQNVTPPPPQQVQEQGSYNYSQVNYNPLGVPLNPPMPQQVTQHNIVEQSGITPENFWEQLENNPEVTIAKIANKIADEKVKQAVDYYSKELNQRLQPLESINQDNKRQQMIQRLIQKYPDYEMFVPEMAEILETDPMRSVYNPDNFLEMTYLEAKGKSVDKIVEAKLQEKLTQMNQGIQMSQEQALTTESGASQGTPPTLPQKEGDTTFMTFLKSHINKPRF